MRREGKQTMAENQITNQEEINENEDYDVVNDITSWKQSHVPKDKYEASDKLMSSFELSDKQANAILEMRLQRLTSLEVEKLKEDFGKKAKKIYFVQSQL